MLITFFPRYLNTTYIKKQKYTDADLSYGGISTDTADQLLEIGEVSRSKKVKRSIKGHRSMKGHKFMKGHKSQAMGHTPQRN